MSFTYLTPDNMKTIEGLLVEVRVPGPERSFDPETAQARLLVRGFEQGMHAESDLRRLLVEHVKLHKILDSSHQL